MSELYDSPDFTVVRPIRKSVTVYAVYHCIHTNARLKVQDGGQWFACAHCGTLVDIWANGQRVAVWKHGENAAAIIAAHRRDLDED